jgi:hypothetical protein
MGHESPIGLLVIRDSTDKVVRTAAFRFYQNAVDYLSSYAQPRNWEKIESDTYKTPTGFVVSVVLMIPEGIDLNKEKYLEKVNDQEGQSKKSAKS